MKRTMKTIFKSILVAAVCLCIPMVGEAQNDSVTSAAATAVTPVPPALPSVDSVVLQKQVPVASVAVDSGSVVPATKAPGQEQNVYGTTQYYNYEDDPDYYRQPKNPYRTFGHNFNKLFVEGVLLAPSYGNIALGGHIAYIPQQWGGYVAVMNSLDYYPSEFLLSPSDWYAVGAAFRCSDPRDLADFQLYGGLMFHEGAGCELGLRYATDNYFGNRGLSWWSFSFSLGYVNHTSFFTVGLSLGIVGTGALGLLFL